MVLVDVVGGDNWLVWIDLFECGGCYICLGVIVGLMVFFDLCMFYLCDLMFIGLIVIDLEVMFNLVCYIESK